MCASVRICVALDDVAHKSNWFGYDIWGYRFSAVLLMAIDRFRPEAIDIVQLRLWMNRFVFITIR